MKEQRLSSKLMAQRSLHGHSISPAHSSLATVRFLVSPINPADINQIQGAYPSKPPFTSALSTSKPAAVPGNEGVAEVISAGSGAVAASGDKLQKGDWVIMKAPGFGTWRTHAQGEAKNFVKLCEETRQGINAVQAGTVSVNPCTAWAMLKGFAGGEGAGRGVDPGQWFIQNGANSGVGRAAIQLAKAWDVKSINIIRARPEGEEETRKLRDELKSLGADVVLTEEEASEKGFTDRIKEFTNGGREPVSLALNCVGGRSALNIAKVLDSSSWHVTYGAMAKQPVSIPAGFQIFKDLRYAGFWVSRWSEKCLSEKQEAVAEVLRLTKEGKFKDVPVQECRWDGHTEEQTLKDAVAGTLSGFRAGKGIFVFGET